MDKPTLTKEELFSLIPSQDNAPVFRVCAGIDTAHTTMKASIYFDFVQRQLSNLNSNDITDDDMFVLADLLEMVKALRSASGVR